VRSIATDIVWKRVSYGLNKDSVSTKSRPGSLEWELSNLACVKANTGDKPILLFVNSTETVRSGKVAKPTKQAVACAKVVNSVFKDGKFKIQIASKSLTCLWMDVTSIKPETSKNLCSAKAPIVAMYTKDGKLKFAYKQNGVTLNPVYSGACKLLRFKKTDLSRTYAAVYKNLDKLYQNEIKLFRAKKVLTAEQTKLAKLAKKTPSAEAKVTTAKKAVEKYLKISEQCKATCKTALDKFVI
jgi:hypothetical protein